MPDNSQPKQPDARVRNATDKEQLKEAKRTQKDEETQAFLDLQEILELPAGKRLLWRILTHCKTFSSVWAPSSLISYNSGMQDVGHFLLDEITKANPEALIQMMKDNRKELV